MQSDFGGMEVMYPTSEASIKSRDPHQTKLAGFVELALSFLKAPVSTFNVDIVVDLTAASDPEVSTPSTLGDPEQTPNPNGKVQAETSWNDWKISRELSRVRLGNMPAGVG
ncbi:hypothetical protein N7478_006094 [Penicillium angulare]|uniref:uncharacterized protein n=1 Tax=Penicillium angulare TaxID=116970 RepID=UPI00254148BB|nr:uncharacterized protein N7478_006094 [Penicillium angulare]KAJ5280722.1 hypothetical protein N7478_006094 [Penicillium angulare]